MPLHQIHHVAYRCRDAKHTVLWYQQMLKMEFLYALPAQAVPRLDVPDPGIQVFLGTPAGTGPTLSFIELAGQPAVAHEDGAPAWIQHISLRVPTLQALASCRDHLLSEGVKLLGETNQGLFQAIHFADLDGHRIEIRCPDLHEAEQLRQLGESRWEMLDSWSQTRRPPTHPALLHASAFAETVQMDFKT
jgi:catechol 2,3-dioxygenase-like lactoylglutathione lyase family enzyme